MTKRIDEHAPSNIVPSDYEYVACYTHRGDPFYNALANKAAREDFNRHREAHPGATFSNHEHGGDCDVCGAFMIDYVIFYHKPSNKYIRTGHDCAEKIGSFDEEAFKAIRDERRAYEKAKAGKNKARAILKEEGLADFAASIFNEFEGRGLGDKSFVSYDLAKDLKIAWVRERAEGNIETAADIITKLVKYGSLSEKAWNFLRVLKGYIEEAKEKDDAESEKRKGIENAPTGKTHVKGKVLAVKLKEGPYGDVLKFLVEAEEGYKVWSTVPKAIDAKKGDIVEFNVNLTPSDDDPTFAFGKRPSKARIIKNAE